MRLWHLTLLFLLVACSAVPPDQAAPAEPLPTVTLTPPAATAEAIPRPATPSPAPATSPTAVPFALPEACRPGSDAQAPYVHVADGYCLLYPTAYSLTDGPEGGVRFLSRPFDTPDGQLQTYIAVRIRPASGGQDLGAVVARHLDAHYPGQAGELTAATLGEATALRVLLTDAAGETAVHYLAAAAERLYDLSFGPAAVPGAAALDVAALERTVPRTFHLLSPSLIAALATCPAPAPDRVPFISLGDGYCLDFPRPWRLRQNVPLSSVILDREMTPADGPAIRLSVTINSGGAAAGRTLERIVTDYLGEITPQMRPLVTQGEGMVGGHRLVALDGIPGIYLTRQAFALVDGRLFAFTITPYNDPQFTALQPEIATSWDDVLGTLRFLEPGPAGE